MALSLSTWFFLGTLGFTLAAPLGPVNMQMIKLVLSDARGWLWGFLTGIGAMTGDFLISMTVLFVGAEYLAFLISIKWVSVLLFLANAAILGYIGFGAIRSKVDTAFLDPSQNGTNAIDEGVEPQSTNRLQFTLKQYIFGFVIVTTSPWSYLWWASFGPVILGSDIILETFFDRFVVTMMFLTGIFAWVLLLNGALMISHKFASQRTLNLITKASASLILVFAISIFIDAVWLVVYDEPLQLISRFFELFS